MKKLVHLVELNQNLHPLEQDVLGTGKNPSLRQQDLEPLIKIGKAGVHAVLYAQQLIDNQRALRRESEAIFPGRPRLPFGENPDKAYNFSLYSLDAMLASHEINARQPASAARPPEERP